MLAAIKQRLARRAKSLPGKTFEQANDLEKTATKDGNAKGGERDLSDPAADADAQGDPEGLRISLGSDSSRPGPALIAPLGSAPGMRP